MSFILGCNYWASNAGAEMWRDFDINAIEKDMKTLSSHGVKDIRVFPNWRDFQPVMPIYTDAGSFAEYRLEGERKSENPYYLDEVVLERFSLFLDVCEKYSIKVIVGLITGWMSGRLFVPPALYSKNIITDHLAQYFQQLFIRGFIERFKDRETIIAWDLGNECNGMSPVEERFQAANWTSIVSNAIRSADPTRPVISGMHGLEAKGKWMIKDQAMFTDMLTTHPYPYWSEHTRVDNNLSFRTSLHPTAQTKYYAEIGGKPCMAEETGTMGPMLCSNEKSADFIRVNMFSLWANGSTGYMWWCANEQDHLTTFPYTAQMVETELGMIDGDGKPKPVLGEMKKFSEFLSEFKEELPPARTDAVCIVSQTQDQWGVGYMTYLLSRKAGINCSFAYSEDILPESDLYLLPSVNGIRVMPKENYLELKKRVSEGADLYISIDDGILSGFEDLAGLKVIDSFLHAETGEFDFQGEKIAFKRTFNLICESAGAQILANDNEGNPILSVYKYGKGRVFFAAFPLENNLVDERDAFSKNYTLVYKTLFKEYAESYPICVKGDDLVLTYHDGNEKIVVVLNHSDKDSALEFELADGVEIEEVLYGNKNVIKAFDACVFKLRV